MSTTKKQFTIYLLCAFGGAYALEILASSFAGRGDQMGFTLFLSGIMYVPFLAVLIARIPLKGMGWVPHLKGKVRFVLIALWSPAVLSALGAALFYAIFPQSFDAGLQTIRTALEQAGGLETIEAAGLTVPRYLAMTTVLSVTVGPFINMPTAIGEEVGWRGAMYPYLKAKLGVTRGRIVGGALWGMWHWPVMILAGYEYGKQYLGAPVLGPLVFCLATIAMGIVQDHLYDRTRCIWIPTLFHGAVNAFTVFAYLLKPEYQSYMILGPCYIGLVSMIPLALTAVLLSRRAETQGPPAT